MASTSDETNPERFLRGLQHLSWYDLERRFRSSAAAEIVIRDNHRSIEAGRVANNLAEGTTHDFKCDAKLTLDTDAFKRIAFRTNDGADDGAAQEKKEKKMSASLTDLLSSVTIDANPIPPTQQAVLAFGVDEACLMFGISDMSNMVLGHELAFDRFTLKGSCMIFPPPLASEVVAERIAVKAWPDEGVPEGWSLQVYNGKDAPYKVVDAEQGKAWKARGLHDEMRILRVVPHVSNDTLGVEADDPGGFVMFAEGSSSDWTNTTTKDFPIDGWVPRYLLRLCIRPDKDSGYLQGAFMDNAKGFLLPGDDSLSCLGVWLRLRPSVWQRRFSPGAGVLRLEIGHCDGNKRSELFDKRFKEFSSSVKDELQAVGSSMRKSVALEMSQATAFIQAQRSWAMSIDVVLFVPLGFFKQLRTEPDESRDQFNAVGIICDQISKVANLVDVVPIISHSVDLGTLADRTTVGGFGGCTFSGYLHTEEQKKQLARAYYSCDGGEDAQMLPPEMLRMSDCWVVWTSRMRKLFTKYEEMKHAQRDCIVEVQSLMHKSGVTTALCAVRQRLLENGGCALLFLQPDVEKVISTVEHLQCAPGMIAVLMDCYVETPQELFENLKERCQGSTFFLVHHRRYRNGRLPQPTERSYRITITPVWPMEELFCLVSLLIRSFSGATVRPNAEVSASNDTDLVKALNDALAYAKDDTSCRHVFLFVFIASTGLFHPLPDLIRTARETNSKVGKYLWDSPKRLFDAVAFVSATGPIGWGVPHSSEFDPLLTDEWGSKVLVKKMRRIGELPEKLLVRYVHPYVARIHLMQIAASAEGPSFKEAFPSPGALMSLWARGSHSHFPQSCYIRDDLEMLVHRDEHNEFFTPIFAINRGLSPLAEHFLQARASRTMLAMCEGLIDPVHFDVLKSKLLRRERAFQWQKEAFGAANKAYKADKNRTYMTAFNLAMTHVIIYSCAHETENAHHRKEALKFFEEALNRASGNVEQQENSVRTQVTRFFGLSVWRDQGYSYPRLKGLLNRQDEIAADPDMEEEEGMVISEWLFLRRWSDM